MGVNSLGDMPDSDKLPVDAKNTIMYIALPIGNGNILMASDALSSMGFKVTEGNNFYISVNVDSKEDADRVNAGLSAGGKI